MNYAMLAMRARPYVTAATPPPPPDFSWDISRAAFSQSFSVASQVTNGSGIAMKPDGTRMYICDFDSDAIHEYSLSTPWSVSTAAYSRSGSVLNNSSIPYGLAISDNGSKLIISDTLSDSVLEYSFGTAWDISTLSFVQQFSVAAQIVSAGGVYVSPDGARLYIVDLTSDDINQYGLSSPWDVSTAGYVQSHIGSSTWDSLPRGVTFRQNGLRMYVVGIDGDRVYEYSLSVAWDISTATYTQNLSVLNKDTMPEAVTFSPDGTRLFVLGRATDSVYQYNIS